MIKTHTNRIVAAGTLGALALSTVLGVATTPTAHADSSATKKVAIGAGIVTGYGLLKGKGKVATIGGVATAGSYLLYRKQKKKEEAKRRAWYQQRYGSAWRNHYKPGS